MSQYSESYEPRTGEPAAEPSVAGVARDEAADLGQHDRQAGGQVTQTATDQAQQVATEAARQVRDLLGEAQGQARNQASAQQKKAALQLHSVAEVTSHAQEARDRVTEQASPAAADTRAGAEGRPVVGSCPFPA